MNDCKNPSSSHVHVFYTTLVCKAADIYIVQPIFDFLVLENFSTDIKKFLQCYLKFEKVMCSYLNGQKALEHGVFLQSWSQLL